MPMTSPTGLRRVSSETIAATGYARRYSEPGTKCVTRPAALNVAKLAAAAMGLKTAKLALIDQLFASSKPADWTRPGVAPVVWPSNERLARRLGVKVSTMKHHLNGLVRAGLVAYSDGPTYQRRGRRDEEGHIVEGYDNYNHPKYDPMWATLEETGMVVNFHSGASQPYDQTLPGWVGIYCVEYPFWLSRPLIAMIFGGVFDRFPKLKVAVTEVGGDFWWPSLMQLMDFRAKVKKGSAKMGDHSAKLKLTPSEYIRRNVWIGSSAQMDDQNYEDYHKIGIDRVMWGTDYPHPEGTWPNTHEQMHGALDGLNESDLEKVLGLNAVECFDLDVEALNKIAARIGPLKSQFKQAA